MIRLLCIVGVLLSSLSARAGEHRIFHLPFGEKGLEAMRPDGPQRPLETQDVTLTEGAEAPAAAIIPVGGNLVYEGSGSFYIPSGTLSFRWRADADPLKVEAGLLSLSSMQRFYFSRWLHVITKNQRIGLTLYHGNSGNVFEDEGSVPATGAARRKKTRHELFARRPIVAGEWVHVAITWDMARGVVLYLDGKEAAAVRKPWLFMGSANHLSLGSHSSSYSKSGKATFPQSFADVAVYDCWMDAPEIARLAKGEPVDPAANLEQMFTRRAGWLGLNNEIALPEVPLAADESAPVAHLQQLSSPEAYDVKRRSYSALDGDLGRAWPMYQGYSASGELLQVKLPSEPSLQFVQALASGQMQVSAVAEGSKEPLLEIKSAIPRLFTNAKPAPAGTSALDFQREDGLIFHISLLNLKQGAFPEEGQSGWLFYPLERGEVKAASPIARDYAPYERLMLETVAPKQEKADTGEPFQLPARRAIHLLGPVASAQEGVGELAFDLALKGAPERFSASIAVIDPVNANRRTFLGNLRFVQSEPGDTRARLVVDLRDLVIDEGQQPWVVLMLSEELELDLAESRFGVRKLPVEVAKKEFTADQWAVVQDEFQEMSESRPWAHDPKRVKWLGSLLRKIDAVRALDPDNEVVNSYWHWTHPSEPPPAVELPKPPVGAPEWAFYTHKSVGLFRDAAHWWIDHRQTEEGEFGAPDGINDDTDLIQDWLAIDLMQGPDEKIRESVDKVADISWRLKTTDGVSNQVTDTLHIYEWGINAQTLAFVMRYGDPVYYSRLLRFASYYPKLMVESCDGKHLHFKSWYFGANRVITEGIYGRDILLNALLLQPAMLLAWYNGDEESTRLVTRWTTSMQDHVSARMAETNRVPGVAVAIPSGESIPEGHLRGSFPEAVWASYDLTGDRSHLEFLGRLIEAELTRPPLRDANTTAAVAPAYLAATKDGRWDKVWEEKARDPQLWQRSIHNNNYRQLNLFYSNWLRSGEVNWINEGSRLALYHMTWSMSMLTEAEATTDRVWLPQSLANMSMLGDLSILRNRIYPRHAVSWENASGAFSPLVHGHATDRLKVELWNLEKEPVKVDARLWGLAAGEYEVALTAHLPGEEEASEPVVRKETLERYSLLPLEIPAGGRLMLEAKQLRADGDHRQRTDLAISTLDARYLPERKVLVCTVYNIGRVETGEYEMEAMKADGTPILKSCFASLPPPKDYRTATKEVEIPVANPSEPITIALKGDAREITLHNNQVTLTPAHHAP